MEDHGVGSAVSTPARSTTGQAIHGAHRVHLYEDDDHLARSVARFVGGGLGAGDAVVVIATSAHRSELEERLRAHGLDIAAARARRRYVPLDAAEVLSAISIGGEPDAGRFADVVGGVIRDAAVGGRVRAFGEMVALLWTDGK